MTFRIAQESEQLKENWWRWAIWLDGTPAEMDSTTSVKWILHPTFPQPIRVISDSKTKFRLDGTGWGEFTVNAEINLTSGEVVKKRHWLRFRGTTGAEVQKSSSSGKTVFVSSSVADSTFAYDLGSRLKEHGFAVRDNADVQIGRRSDEAALAAMRDAAGTVVILSGAPSPYIQREVAALRAASIPIVPVLIGEKATIPSDWSDIQAIRIKGGSDEEIKFAAQAIGETITKRLA